MSEHETDQLTLVEVLLLATNEKIKADLVERSEWHERAAKALAKEMIPVDAPRRPQQPAQTRSAYPCPACRKWARRRKALRMVRRILVGMAIAAAMMWLIWVAGEVW